MDGENRLIQGLLSLARTLTSALPLEARLTAVCGSTTELLGCTRSSIFIRERDRYRSAVNQGNPPDIRELFPRAWFPLDHPAVVEATRTKGYVLIEDAQSSPLFDSRAARKYRIHSIVIAPMIDPGGETLGILTGEYNETPGRFSADESALVLGFAHLAGLALVTDRHEQERCRMEGELRRALDEAEQADRLKGEFLANVSHEIRTPLNVILGYNGVLAEELRRSLNETQGGYFETVRLAGQRLARTVNSVLDLSKIESGIYRTFPEWVALAEMLEGRVDEIRAEASAKGIDLSLEIAEPNAEVFCDRHCLSESIAQLLDNAVKFTPKGAIDVKLGRDEPGALCIEVRDTGIGIGTGYQTRLFSAFSQEHTGSTRPFEGVGVGLSLVRRYLELNGARISVSSESGSGSVFGIHFDAAPERVSGTATESAEVCGPIAVDKPAVLVVEDDTETQLYMRALLQGRFRVLSAASGEEARRVLESHRGGIPVVLMDLSLRGDEDGLTLTRFMREHASWKNVPVIATTAHAFAEDRHRALEAGCTAFLAKPFRPKDLLSMMGKLMHTASAERNVGPSRPA